MVVAFTAAAVFALVGGECARAVDQPGITREQAPDVLPLPPARLAVRTTRGTVLLTWAGTREDARRYNVYRRTARAKVWKRIGSVPARGDNTGPYEFRDETARAGTRYLYGVAAVGLYDREGARSVTAAVAK